MIVALLAIASVMVLCFVFGYKSRGWVECLKDSDTDDIDADHDRWEDDPEPTVIRRDTCDTCKHQKVKWYDEPCLSCAHGDDTNNWEANSHISANSPPVLLKTKI